MNYSDILKKIALKEVIAISLILIILFLLLTMIWVISFRSFKNNSVSKHNTSTKPIVKKNCILGLIFITIFSIAIVFIFLFSNIRYLHNIYKDINENSYITYKGSYYIMSSAIDANPPAPTFVDVNLETDKTLRLYTSLSEWFYIPSLEENDGVIIYGENSNIIVNIQNY